MGRGFGCAIRIGAWVSFCLALSAAAEQAPTPETPSCVRGRDLMTPAEVMEHRAKMQSLQSDEERAAFRRANHEEMKKRAAARGTVLCDERMVGPTTDSTAPAGKVPPPSK